MQTIKIKNKIQNIICGIKASGQEHLITEELYVYN